MAELWPYLAIRPNHYSLHPLRSVRLHIRYYLSRKFLFIRIDTFENFLLRLPIFFLRPSSCLHGRRNRGCAPHPLFKDVRAGMQGSHHLPNVLIVFSWCRYGRLTYIFFSSISFYFLLFPNAFADSSILHWVQVANRNKLLKWKSLFSIG